MKIFCYINQHRWKDTAYHRVPNTCTASHLLNTLSWNAEIFRLSENFICKKSFLLCLFARNGILHFWCYDERTIFPLEWTEIEECADLSWPFISLFWVQFPRSAFLTASRQRTQFSRHSSSALLAGKKHDSCYWLVRLLFTVYAVTIHPEHSTFRCPCAMRGISSEHWKQTMKNFTSDFR